VYIILSGPWIRKTFPKLFYIVSPGIHSGGAYHPATWSGISDDNFHGRYVGADFSIVDNPWLDQHVPKQRKPSCRIKPSRPPPLTSRHQS
jgi:hypothetical protein